VLVLEEVVVVVEVEVEVEVEGRRGVRYER